jgi:hypothetical protein
MYIRTEPVMERTSSCPLLSSKLLCCGRPPNRVWRNTYRTEEREGGGMSAPSPSELRICKGWKSGTSPAPSQQRPAEIT